MKGLYNLSLLVPETNNLKEGCFKVQLLQKHFKTWLEIKFMKATDCALALLNIRNFSNPPTWVTQQEGDCRKNCKRIPQVLSKPVQSWHRMQSSL